MTDFGLYVRMETNWDSILKNALLAEEHNFKSAWINDHLIGLQKGDEEMLEAWTIMTAIAAKTKKLKVGHTVLCNNFRNPALLAKMVTTLDVISKGRVELAIGAGWYEKEYLAYGYPFLSAGERVKQLKEALIIINKMFKEEEFDFEGEFWQLKGCRNDPKPFQKEVPIWVGGDKRKIMRVAAELATGINLPYSTFEDAKKILGWVAEDCDTFGRKFDDFKKSYFTVMHLTKTEEEAYDIAKRAADEKKTPEEILEQRFLGTPEFLLEKITRFRDELDMSYFMVAVRGTETIEEPITLFSDEIMKGL